MVELAMIFGRKHKTMAREPTPLPVPPFAPDVPLPDDLDLDPGPGAVAALEAHGVSLPGAIFRGNVGSGVPVWTVPVEKGRPAADLWQRVRDLHPSTGIWPLLVTEQTWQETEFSVVRAGPPNGSMVSPGDGANWMESRAGRRPVEEHLRRSPLTELPPADDSADWADLLNVVAEQDQLALVPAPAGWLLPGLIDWYGATNYELYGQEHATVLRRWAGRWGAELCGLGFDTMTLRVDRPPVTVAEALEFAVEIYLYCPDAVDQGTGTIDRLAEGLGAALLTMWWD